MSDDLTCPDCHVQPSRPHADGCDMARCTVCGEQRITCKHGGSDTGWGQIWPGPTSFDYTRLSDRETRRRNLRAYLEKIREVPVSAPSPAAEALLAAFDEVQLAEMHAAASARIKRVRALHVREYETCAWCSTNDRHVVWPCPTIQALDGEEPS